jgi:hypothetical protein
MEPHTHTPRSHILGAIAVATVIIVGGLVAMRQEVLTAIHANAETQQAETKKLADKLALIDSRLTAVESAPKVEVDSASNEKLELELANAKDSIALLDARLADMEKTPAPLQPIAAPVASPAPTPVPTPALEASLLPPSDVASEATLREQFRDIVARLNNPPAAAESDRLQRLNTRLAGLISIKKAVEPPKEYAALAAIDSTTPLEAIVAKVDALPESARAPFTEWREAVRQRAAAIAKPAGGVQ